MDYKGDAEIPDRERKPAVTKRGARFSVRDRKRFADGNEHEKRRVSNWGGKRDMIKYEKLENDPRNSTVHSNKKQDSRKSDKGKIKGASAQSSSAATHQKLLDDFDCKIQLGTENNNKDKVYSEGNMTTFASEERKQKNNNTELSGLNAVDGR